MNLRFWRRPVAAASAPVKDESRPAMKIRSDALTVAPASVPTVKAFTIPSAPPGVIPPDVKLACDAAMGDAYEFAGGGAWSEGLGFMGYAYFSELAQRPEYRRPAEIIAKEMTRKWVKLQASGDEDKTDKLAKLEAALKRLKVQSVFRKVAEHDGIFGRSQIFVELNGGRDDPDELATPLLVAKEKIAQGALTGLRVIEPIWTYPADYNATDPMREDYFRPSAWYVQGKKVHRTRLLTFVSREVPDILKPAYVFGGLSLLQMMKPYVDNWIRTRQSVSDTIHNFSVSVLATNLGTILNGGAAQAMFDRAQMFVQVRDNRGLMMIDKDSEEFTNVSTPLSGLDELQAQSQEHMAAVTGIPLVKLLGITPSGLNASSDGEMRAFYDWVEALQEQFFSDNFQTILNIIQLSEFGEIDPAIGFAWNPLWGLDEAQLAAARKAEADTDCEYIDRGVLSPHEVRARLAGDEDSPYAALDLDEDPPMPDPADEGGPEEGGDDKQATDAGFEEEKHPRAENGKFGSGGSEAEGKYDAHAESERGTKAMGEVISSQTDVHDAMDAPGLGPVSFIWGQAGNAAKDFAGGHGIAKIIAKRNSEGHDGAAVARKMPEVIAHGVQTPRPGGLRVNISHEGHTAVLSLGHHGAAMTWLLTGWKED